MERGLTMGGGDSDVVPSNNPELLRSLKALDSCLHVDRTFVVVIDDPLGVSYIGPRQNERDGKQDGMYYVAGGQATTLRCPAAQLNS